METLVKKSGYMKEKYKFFINRAFIYVLFLMIPTILPRIVNLSLFSQSIIILCYMLFMGGQWYLLGKELDHRLKIYYRANSSLDRVLYRILFGNIIVILMFNIFSLLPSYISEYLFWLFFIVVGLFYSWPTRGKIIEESISGQLGEYRFLDSFERTVLSLSFVMFIVSTPEVSLFENIDALKLYIDGQERIHSSIWSFLSINYIPFKPYPHLYNLSWSFHLYFYGVGLFVTAFYCLCRLFYSRRIALLGVFALISTWSYSKILAADISTSFTTTFGLLWAWSLLWSTKSGTYRSGLFVGLLLSLGTMIDIHYSLLFPVTALGVYFSFMNDRTVWFRRQWLKYLIFGFFINVIVCATHFDNYALFSSGSFETLSTAVTELIYRKAFYVISIIGLIMLLAYKLKIGKKSMATALFDNSKLNEIIFIMMVICSFSIFVDSIYSKGFSLVWIIAFLSLFPLEWIFQSISRLRSKRNVIYAMYILVCLLDSHFEGRFRIIGKMFLNEETFKYFNQM